MRILGIFVALATSAAGCGGAPAPPVDSALVAPDAVNEDTGQPITTRTGALAPEPEGLPSPVEPELLRDVGRQPDLVGWTIVPLAQLDRGDRSLVFVWPAFDPDGDLTTDRDYVAYLLETREDGRHAVVHESSRGRTLTRELIARELGGSDFVVRDRGAGTELELLGEAYVSLPQRFVEAVEAGDREAAVAHAVAYSRIQSLWVIGNVGGDLLRPMSGLRLEHLGTSEPQGGRAHLRLRVHVPGEGTADPEYPVHQLPDQTGWVVGPGRGPSP